MRGEIEVKALLFASYADSFGSAEVPLLLMVGSTVADAVAAVRAKSPAGIHFQYGARFVSDGLADIFCNQIDATDIQVHQPCYALSHEDILRMNKICYVPCCAACAEVGSIF